MRIKALVTYHDVIGPFGSFQLLDILSARLIGDTYCSKVPVGRVDLVA